MAGKPKVVGGVDTHADTLHVAVLTMLGRKLADKEFHTDARGYWDAIRFMTGHGRVQSVGVEGTSSYGAGLTKALITAGLEVIEVNRPDRAARRRRGKSDPLDAELAARAVLSGNATSAPKDPTIEAIRALFNARRSAVKARAAAMNQITSLLVTAPDPLRAKYRPLKENPLVNALASCRPGGEDPIAAAVLTALKTLAKRHQFLTSQADELEAQVDVLVTAANPALRAAFGVGPNTAAQLLITAGGNPERLRSEASFAALCGAAPVQASSGKTSKHRLSRGGDRGGNCALHRIALVRMSSHPQTREYVARQRKKNKSTKAILRMLKRAIAREMLRLLTHQIPIDDYSDLRPARQTKNITVTAVAEIFDVWPTIISRLERGLYRNDVMAEQYREWLTAA
jgi:transposase